MSSGSTPSTSASRSLVSERTRPARPASMARTADGDTPERARWPPDGAYVSDGPGAHPVAWAQASASRMVAQMKGSLASV
jgi:hypothetical protein